ncbi:putative helicase senataxin isoform X2 [Temnothorax americanus]
MDIALERVHDWDNTRIVLERNRSYTCGRGKENDIICPNVVVSRRHCIFFRDNENSYVSDLRSSNGTYVNGKIRASSNMIKLHENDIIGIGCPNTDPDNETLYIYKVCLIRPSILDEEEEEETTFSTTILTTNTLQSSESSALRKRCIPNLNCDMTVPNKISKITYDKHDSSVSPSKGINSNLSHNNQNPHNNNSINNLVKTRHDTVDINAEDDIQIIHTSLAKDVEKKNSMDHNHKSAKCSDARNKLDFDERMNVSSIETNSDGDVNRDRSKSCIRKTSNSIDKQDDALLFTENFVHTGDQIIKYENELQITDDEEACRMTVGGDKTHDKSPIKLKKKKHEPKTRFSIIDVVDLSDDEEGMFPWSQLFDIKYEDNTENKMEIKQECASDDDLNTEKIGLLNVDDEVIILTDNEDEDNPWLERLSRSQLLNEDKPVSCDAIVKDEIDLGIWDDEVPNMFEPSEIPSTSHGPCSKEISPKPRAGVDVTTKNKKDDYNTNLPTTEVNAMDVDEVGPSNEPSSKDIDQSKQIVDTDINTNLPTIEMNGMDVDEISPFNEPSMKDIDKGEQIVDININDKSKQIVDININDKSKQVGDISIDNKSKQVVDINIDDKNKRKTDLKQNIEQNKQTIENLKQKLLANRENSSRKLIPVIEPLNLPPRRRHTDRSKNKVTKEHETSHSRSTTKEKTMSKLKEKLSDNFYSKEQKCQKESFKSTADSHSPSETKSGPSISKDEKRKIIEDRKIKLKKIAEKEKPVAENDEGSSRRIAKPRAKISLKNRGDFLIAEQEPRVSKSLPNKSTKLPKSSDDQSKRRSTNKADVVKESATSDKKTQKSRQKTDFSKNTVNNIATSLQQSLHLDNMSTASEESTLGFKAINDNKKKRRSSSSRSSSKRNSGNADSTAKLSESRDRSTHRGSAVQKETVSPSNLKSKLVKSSTKSTKKKRVSFSDKFEIKVYEIDRRNTLKKLEGKDAPIPVNKLTRASKGTYADWTPKLEEFLLHIFMWNPVWLEEQRYLKCEPPIVPENELHSMKLSYDSYKQYYEVAMPLLLLEMWCVMTKEFETIQKNRQRPTMMCSIVENSITRTPIPSTSLFLTTLMLEVLINKDDLNKQTHPIYGDLVYLEYVTNVRDKQIFHKIYGYVTNMQHVIITDFTHYNRDLRKHVKNPYAVITYTLLTRPLEHSIPVNRVQRVRTVMYLRANIRMVQALQYLPHSPLLKFIVSPKVENYQLSPLNEQYTSSSLVTKEDLNPRQLEAVFKVTNAVVKKEAKLCFIQGPPGTGKSKVIVNLVSQILFGQHQDKKSLRILICAPSNAAIDEIVLRLLNVRSILKQKRFNMVRIGRPESMHPKVKNISVTELAKRYLQQMTKTSKSMLNGGLANVEDIAILQARINSLKTELESIDKTEETKRNSLMNKLFETSTTCELLKSGKSVEQLVPKDRAKYKRMSENVIITGANVIACTLSSCYTNQMESIFGGHKERISVCIVDEATQSCEAETLIPLMLGVNTLVLVGDPNQLPATILSQRAKKLGLDQSLFSRMQNVFESQPNSPIIMLDTQYRMDYAISYWPNRHFYSGKLKNAAECRIKFPFHSYRVLYHDFMQNDDKFSNTTEAEFVANIIYTMLMFGKWETTTDTISLGVLTPYNNQRTLVLNKINEK